MSDSAVPSNFSVVMQRLSGTGTDRHVCVEALANMITAGCREVQRYAPEQAVFWEVSLRDLRSALAAGQGVWWVAWEGRKPIGLVGLMPDPRCKEAGTMTGLYVCPQRRRMGVGRRLVESALCDAEALGYQRVNAFVVEESPAITFYRRLGPNRTLSAAPGYLKLEWWVGLSTPGKGDASCRTDD